MTTTTAPLPPAAPAGRPWVAHYEAGVPAEISIPDTTVDGLLRTAAERHPGRTAMLFFGARTSFGELDRAADRFAHVLREMGVANGDRVSIHLPTSPAFVIAVMGTLRAGAIAAPVNPLFVERELSLHFAQVRPAVSVTLDLLVPRLRAVAKAAANDGAGAAGANGTGAPGRLVVTG